MSLYVPPKVNAAAGPPADHYYASAVWLCLRHPRLLHLADRAGVVVEDADGDTVLDLDELAAALNALDAYWLAWADYTRRSEPSSSASDAVYDAWAARGPQFGHPRAAAIAPMSRTEVSRLRLLAFFSNDRIALRVADLGGLDDEGRSLLTDWTRAALAA